jgi:AcrR family transcriptional regulator
MARKPGLSAKRLETRRKLIAAAIEVVARDGFHDATVNAIAQRAGFSIGAVYANFSGKDELFLAVFEEHMRWFEGQVAQVTEAAEPAAAIEHAVGVMSHDRAQFLVFVEFWTYAVRRPKLRRQFAARLAEMRTIVVSALEERALRTGSSSDLPLETIALVGLAVGRGLTLEKFVAPDVISDRTIGDVMGALLAR